MTANIHPAATICVPDNPSALELLMSVMNKKNQVRRALEAQTVTIGTLTVTDGFEAALMRGAMQKIMNFYTTEIDRLTEVLKAEIKAQQQQLNARQQQLSSPLAS